MSRESGRPLRDCNVDLVRRTRAQQPRLRRTPDAIRSQQIEQILRGRYRLTLEFDQDVANQETGGVSRAARRDADNQQATIARCASLLAFGQLHRLTRNAKVPAPGSAVLYYI
jgi:hypothetical protein